MIRALAQALADERLFGNDDAVVVGVSGGSDSMALMYLLLGLNQFAGWSLRLHVAHFNHMLRDNESNADAAFVQAACDSLSLPCTVDRRDIRAASNKDRNETGGGAASPAGGAASPAGWGPTANREPASPPAQPGQAGLLPSTRASRVGGRPPEQPAQAGLRPAARGAPVEGRLGIEELSRRERYAFFERVCLQTGARVLALAHHADDNAETILHRILRGTGLRGLAGIPRQRPLTPDSPIRVVRPLLGLTKAQLRAYLVDSGITFREDRTNSSSEPMRNRIRNLILPQVEAQVNPQVREALNRLGLQARWLDEFLQETVQRTFETLVIARTDRSLSLNADAVLRKSRVVQAELIRTAYAAFGLGEQDLSFSHIGAVLEILADPASGKQIQLPAGCVVEKRYGELSFALASGDTREEVASEIAVHCPGRTVLPIRRLEIECSVEDVSRPDVLRLRRQATRMEEFLDLEAVHPPLIVRGRKMGDRFTPLGAPGSKTLADFLADEKVNPRDRERVAVLCDQLGPIWIIGHRIDDRVKMTELTRRVLHLRARRLEP